MQIQDLVFFHKQTRLDHEILRINPAIRDSADFAASPDSSKSLGLGPPGPGYDAGPDAPRPSSHARRQGLGLPRAIGTHMRRPRLRKCSLSLLFCPFISSVPVNAPARRSAISDDSAARSRILIEVFRIYTISRTRRGPV